MFNTLSNMDDLEAAQSSIENMHQKYPVLFEKFLDTINLTHALQFKYHYLVCLIMDEEPLEEYTPHFVSSSVLRLYQNEILKLKDDKDFQVLKQTISHFAIIGYPKICQLVLGLDPESIVGPSSIR